MSRREERGVELLLVLRSPFAHLLTGASLRCSELPRERWRAPTTPVVKELLFATAAASHPIGERA